MTGDKATYRLLRYVREECGKFVHGGGLDGVVLSRSHKEKRRRRRGELLGEGGELIF